MTKIDHTRYKQTEIALIPDHWKVVRLGEVCKIFSGSSAPQDEKYFENAKYPFVRVRDVGRYGRTAALVNINDYINDSAIEELNLVKAEKGTILFPKSGAAITTNNRAILGIDAFIVSHLAALKPKEGIANNHFVYYWLCLTDMVQYMENPGYPSLKLSTISKISIPLPSLNIQHRIATKIQELMQEVERARTACEKQLEAAKALPAAYLQEVFKSEEAKKWERKMLGEVCEVIMGQSPPGHTYNTEGKGLPFYQGKIEFDRVCLKPPSTWCTQPKKIAEPNDVLISVRAPVGPTNMCNIKCCIGRGLAALRPKNSTESWFVFYSLRHIEQEISGIGQGSTFSAISKSQIQNFKTPFPLLLVQQRIAAELKEKMAEVEKLRTGIEKQLEAITALPQAILKKAFRGDI